MMMPAQYDAWYNTPRGRWIGDREFEQLRTMLNPVPGETLLDVGCGTGYFSRRFAREAGLKVTGVDIDPDMIAFARVQAPEIEFALGNAERLSFADSSFDHVIAVTSLCFVADEQRAVSEMKRIARSRLVLGLLNRNSLLYRQKRRGQSYAGARWHSRAEARELLEDAGCEDISLKSAVFVPEGSLPTRMIERLLPSQLPFGGFLAVAGRRSSVTDRVRS